MLREMHLYSKVRLESATFYNNAGRDAVLPLNSTVNGFFLSFSIPSHGWTILVYLYSKLFIIIIRYLIINILNLDYETVCITVYKLF